MIVLIGGEKGGTGKSTIAVNLAAWLTRRGVDVMVVDTDRQATASHWVDRRHHRAALPVVHCAERHGNVFHAVRDLNTRYEQVIVDAGGRDSEELRTAMVAARKIYVPLKASQPDLETSLHMNELVQLARGMNPKLQAYALIAMAPTNPVINETAEAQKILLELSEFTPSQALICDRKAYRDAMVEGLGVVEMGNEKAAAEVDRLANEIYG